MWAVTTLSDLLEVPWPSTWTKENVSSAMGMISIGCWVVAQAPQFWENYVSQSCQGLALPFLVNWLAGDITNLVGCILTDQKEFQTLLAAYFCLIDLVLTGQYVYYSQPRFTQGPSQIQAPNQADSGIRARAYDPSSPVNHNTRPDEHTNTSNHSLFRSHSQQGLLRSPNPRPSSLTEAALDVALAAERVERSRSRRRYGSESRTRSNNAFPAGSTSRERGNKLGLGLGDSYISEASLNQTHGNDERRDRGYSASSTREASQASSPRLTTNTTTPKSKSVLGLSTSPSVTFNQDPAGTRGRQPEGLPLPVDGRSNPSTTHNNPPGGPPRTRSSSRIRGSENKPASVRPPGGAVAGVVFMGVWTLAGLNLNGRLGGGTGTDSNLIGRGWGTSLERGRAGSLDVRWGRLGLDVGRKEGTVISPRWTGTDIATAQDTDILELYFASPSGLSDNPPPGDSESEPDHPSHKRWDKAAVQRLIGRMSAWICTTLYLTSRLPQIWKNYQRKSVEGLSILLFVFAFCGNLTYVLSIVLNPTGSDGESNPEMVGYYLLEALPYLLGSGGTLVFDLTIMIQSLIYGSAPPIDERDQEDYIEPQQHHHHRSRSSRRHSKRITDEESRPLIERPDEE